MKTRIRLFAVLAVLLAASFAWAGVETSTDEDGVILAGYDAVAYFTEGRPVQGDARFTAVHDGAVYRFASAAHRDAFKADPGKYAPAYGGYCAYGTSLGKKFPVNGKAFEVVDGTLYVNKNESVYDTWSKDKPGNIRKADGQWPRIREIPAGDL
jgi:YHS domain-containing protein